MHRCTFMLVYIYIYADIYIHVCSLVVQGALSMILLYLYVEYC